ncbi:hypothetical protein [Pleomorphomonas koreensis]|nr:hypothetical protein [Pleomorphomonas koreensis]
MPGTGDNRPTAPLENLSPSIQIGSYMPPSSIRHGAVRIGVEPGDAP